MIQPKFRFGNISVKNPAISIKLTLNYIMEPDF